MSSADIKKLKKLAQKYFYRGEYEKAMYSFSLALMHSPNDRESKIGAMLTDMAREDEEKAHAIYDYYQITKEIEKESAEEIIETLIDSSDMDIEFNDLLYDEEFFPENLEEDNSINYKDFVSHIKKRGDFKLAYQDIMFSTKVLINKKEDLVDFLEKLIDNGYSDAAMNYAEAALSLFPRDTKIQKVFEKVKKTTI